MGKVIDPGNSQDAHHEWSWVGSIEINGSANVGKKIKLKFKLN